MALWKLVNLGRLTLGNVYQGKMNPRVHLITIRKVRKTAAGEGFRPLHVINDNSYCRALLRMTASLGLVRHLLMLRKMHSLTAMVRVSLLVFLLRLVAVSLQVL